MRLSADIYHELAFIGPPTACFMQGAHRRPSRHAHHGPALHASTDQPLGGQGGGGHPHSLKFPKRLCVANVNVIGIKGLSSFISGARRGLERPALCSWRHQHSASHRLHNAPSTMPYALPPIHEAPRPSALHPQLPPPTIKLRFHSPCGHWCCSACPDPPAPITYSPPSTQA